MIVVCWKTNLFKKTKEVQFSKNINFTTKASLKNRLKGLLQGKLKSHVVWFRKRGLVCLKKKEKRRKQKKDSIFDICFEGRFGSMSSFGSFLIWTVNALEKESAPVRSENVLSTPKAKFF